MRCIDAPTVRMADRIDPMSLQAVVHEPVRYGALPPPAAPSPRMQPFPATGRASWSSKCARGAGSGRLRLRRRWAASSWWNANSGWEPCWPWACCWPGPAALREPDRAPAGTPRLPHPAPGRHHLHRPDDAPGDAVLLSALPARHHRLEPAARPVHPAGARHGACFRSSTPSTTGLPSELRWLYFAFHAQCVFLVVLVTLPLMLQADHRPEPQAGAGVPCWCSACRACCTSCAR
jgi:hypothetical protein